MRVTCREKKYSRTPGTCLMVWRWQRYITPPFPTFVTLVITTPRGGISPSLCDNQVTVNLFSKFVSGSLCSCKQKWRPSMSSVLMKYKGGSVDPAASSTQLRSMCLSIQAEMYTNTFITLNAMDLSNFTRSGSRLYSPSIARKPINVSTGSRRIAAVRKSKFWR